MVVGVGAPVLVATWNFGGVDAGCFLSWDGSEPTQLTRLLDRRGRRRNAGPCSSLPILGRIDRRQRTCPGTDRAPAADPSWDGSAARISDSAAVSAELSWDGSSLPRLRGFSIARLAAVRWSVLELSFGQNGCEAIGSRSATAATRGAALSRVAPARDGSA